MAESGDDKELCKVDVIANLFGVSVRRVQQLTQAGITVSYTHLVHRVLRYLRECRTYLCGIPGNIPDSERSDR